MEGDSLVYASDVSNNPPRPGGHRRFSFHGQWQRVRTAHARAAGKGTGTRTFTLQVA